MDIVSALLVLVIVGCFVAAVISERKKLVSEGSGAGRHGYKKESGSGRDVRLYPLPARFVRGMARKLLEKIA